MADDREIARQVADLQSRAHDIWLMNIPAYRRWSIAKLSAGECPSLIAHLDATGMFLLPEDVETMTDDVFDELLDDLKSML